MRIRTRLLALVLSVLLPAFAAASLAVWYVYKELQEAQKKGMAEAAHALALLIDANFSARAGILRTLANSPALASGDLKAFYGHAKNMAPTDESVIVLADLSKKQLINTRLPFGTELPKGKSNLFELRKRYGPYETIVSDLFEAPVSQRYDFAVQVPVMVNNELRYYLSMGVEATQLQSLLTKQPISSGWLTTIIDRNGMVVARSAEPETYVGKQVREALLKRIRAMEKSGVHYGTMLDGRKSAGFFRRAPGSEWTVIVNIPISEIRQPAIDAAAFLGCMMLLLLGAAVFAARQQAKKTAEPIEDLTRAAQSLGQGEPVTVSLSGLRETDLASMAMLNASNEIRRNREQLEQQVAEAVASSERAQRVLLQNQKVEALGRLTAGIAHDFNNVLQTLSTALQLIQLIATQPRVQSLTETCQRAIERAATLTGKLRSFGKVQDANLVTARLSERIGDALPLLRSALPSSIDLDLKIDSKLWPVTIDLQQLELALLNLIINARDAMPNGGRVQLELHNETLSVQKDDLLPGNYVRISVSDNGTGMTPEVLANALEPFFTTKSSDNGSGLGLSQAYGFARQSGGTLVINSTEGKGTTVSIYLPQASAENSTPATRPLQVRKSSDTTTVLFVEDDALVRAAAEPALRDAGFNVLVARTGEEALSLLESGQQIDLVFSDIVMPGRVSGIELARIIKERFADLPVILATGYSDARVTVPGVRLLGKPYNMNDAIQMLSEAA